MSAGQVSSGRTESTATWLAPESNQTSRMFISRSNDVPPQVGHVNPAGTKSLVSLSYQASAAYFSNTAADRSTSSGVTMASPHLVQSTAGIGTPQARCREMHQSGRLLSMLEMRSCPHVGIQRT